MPAELIAGPQGTYAFCPDDLWRSTPTRDRAQAHEDANTHNLTQHLPRWLYGPDADAQPRTGDNDR